MDDRILMSGVLCVIFFALFADKLLVIITVWCSDISLCESLWNLNEEYCGFRNSLRN